MLEVVDFSAGLDKRETTPADVLDALAGQIEDVEDVVVIYQKDGGAHWLCSEFQRYSDLLGFIEWVKLAIAHDLGHEGR